MLTIAAFLCSLCLILSGPQYLWAKTSKPNPSPPATATVQDLESATTDLEENLKDLRRNITSWRKIRYDANLTAAEKKQWRLKAETYMKDCEDYNAVLARIDEKKLPQSPLSRRFLAQRENFLRELQYLRETLATP